MEVNNRVYPPIDFQFYTTLYGTALGTWFYLANLDHGTKGQCYGMAATTATINFGMP